MPVAAPPREEAVILVPLEEIEADSLLLRDRIGKDAPGMEELINSILASGLRMPVELFPLVTPRPPCRYGLVSGFRRLEAFRLLKARSGAATWDRIPALLRDPVSDEAILVGMVEENDVRRDISPWEKARIAVAAAERGWFANTEAAIAALYAAASPVKRCRIRAVARAVELLDGMIAEPWRLTERQCLRIAAAAERERYGEAMQVALEESDSRAFEAQWALLEPVIAEAERAGEPETAPKGEGRPRIVLRPRKGLVIRREKTREGWTLHFTGPLAREGLIEDVLDDIERTFAPA